MRLGELRITNSSNYVSTMIQLWFGTMFRLCFNYVSTMQEKHHFMKEKNVAAKVYGFLSTCYFKHKIRAIKCPRCRKTVQIWFVYHLCTQSIWGLADLRPHMVAYICMINFASIMGKHREPIRNTPGCGCFSWDLRIQREAPAAATGALIRVAQGRIEIIRRCCFKGGRRLGSRVPSGSDLAPFRTVRLCHRKHLQHAHSESARLITISGLSAPLY